MWLVVCFSGAASAGEQLHLALPGFSAVGIPEGRASFFSEYLGAALARAGARVTTAKTVSEVLGMERQRQLLGCSESGCTVELANALGADAIVSGEVAALSSSLQCTIKLLSSRSGEVLEAVSVRAANDEALLDELENVARRMASLGAERLSRDLAVSASQRGPNVRKLAIVPAAIGIAAVVTGAALLFAAKAQLEAIPVKGTEPIRLDDARAHAASGRPLETGGWVAVGVGCAAVAAAVVMFVFGGSASSMSAALTPLPQGGAWAGLGGSF